MDSTIKDVQENCGQCTPKQVVKYLYNQGAISIFHEEYLTIWMDYIATIRRLRGQRNRKMKARQHVLEKYGISIHKFGEIRRKLRPKD